MKLNVSKEFAEKFRLDELLIKSTGSWIISLRPEQSTIGSMVLTLNRICEKMSGISEQEGKELTFAFNEIETLLAQSFSPNKINYLALMMFDEQVHFHVIPRYNKPTLIQDKEYIDSSWPGPPSLKGLEIDNKTMKFVLNILKTKV